MVAEKFGMAAGEVHHQEEDVRGSVRLFEDVEEDCGKPHVHPPGRVGPLPELPEGGGIRLAGHEASFPRGLGVISRAAAVRDGGAAC
ncbi:hypothetical protein MASR2M17_09310 [Aminivibrio sp.]